MVSAGTYHLPYDRLGAWVGSWFQSNPEAHVIYQHGPGRPMDNAENREILPASELMELFRTADAVVLHGGAGGIMDLRAVQRLPIVVPRRPELGEVIDNHQLLFTSQAESLGLVYRANAMEDLARYLDAALEGKLKTRSGPLEPTEGAANAGVLLDTLPRALPWRTTIRRSMRSIPGIFSGLR